MDKRIETDVSSAENESKIEFLSATWSALLAGPVHEAKELAGLYRAYLEGHGIEKATILEQLREPPRTLRRQMANALTHARVALSYDDFLAYGKDQLQEDVYRQLAYDIAAQQILAELILIGWINLGENSKYGEYVLFVCRNGRIESRSNFAAIGSGAITAESSLSQRNYSKAWDLGKSLYTIYEAKKLGQNAPGVGTETIMRIWAINHEGNLRLEPPGKTIWHEIAPSQIARLDRQYGKFGPKPLDELDLKIEDIDPDYET